MTQRVFVLRGGALGDFVLGLPALRLLRDLYPDAHLELIAPRAWLSLAHPLVDAASALELPEVASLFGETEAFPEIVERRYRELGLAVLWLGDAGGSVRRSLQKLGARRILWAPALPPQPGVHAADHLVSTLKPLWDEAGRYGDPPRAVPLVQPDPGLSQGAAERLRSAGIGPGEPFVAIHPGSGGAWKCWPAERFAEVVDRLAEAGRKAVLVEGPADGNAVSEVVSATQTARPPVVSGLEVGELTALLSLAAAYLGNDSGVTHLAAAAGTPVVAVFGPTDPAVWGPRGRWMRVIWDEAGCAPYVRGGAGRPAPGACLDGVTVAQVTQALAEALSPEGGGATSRAP